MNSIIQNENLSVTVSSLGAELLSIKSKDSKNIIEYLWQGDEKYWGGRSPVLFPYVGRLTDGKYKMDKEVYSMRIHGLAQYYEHEIVEKNDSFITYEFKYSEETLNQYPRKFVLQTTYSIVENRIIVHYNVKNCDSKIMYFGIGGHPGFNVPIDKNKKFEDYFIQFDKSCKMRKVCFSDTCFPTGEYLDFVLDENGRLPLIHDLFDNDAIVLTDMGNEVSLECNDGSHKVKVRFSGISYLGLWHRPKTDAPYVCIEPWCTLPSRDKVVEEFETQPGLIKLEANDSYDVDWSMEF